MLGEIRKVEAALKLSDGDADRWEQLSAALKGLAVELAPETREEGSVEAAGKQALQRRRSTDHPLHAASEQCCNAHMP